MDATLRRRMLAYYNERAPEYEDAYILGTGTASIPDPDVFITEADGTSFEIYRRYSDRGDVLDWATKYDATLRVEHFGTAFFAVSGCLLPH